MPAAVLQAWDRQCAFCGFDGQLGTATVGVEAAHIRWFAFDGPDTPDNSLALPEPTDPTEEAFRAVTQGDVPARAPQQERLERRRPTAAGVLR